MMKRAKENEKMKKRCPQCSLLHDKNVEICDCGYDLTTVSDPVKNSAIDAVGSTESKNSSPHYSSAASIKYPALRTLAGLYRLLAIAVGGLALVTAFNLIGDNLMIAFGVLIIGAVFAISLLAVAESIQVLIDIEANTRQAANR